MAPITSTTISSIHTTTASSTAMIVTTTSAITTPIIASINTPIIQSSVPDNNFAYSYIPREEHLKIDRFSGNDPEIMTDRWISLFDVVVLQVPIDSQRVQLLMQYLRSEALNWYADEIAPQIGIITYEKCKQLFIRRFGIPIVDPVVSAQRRRLQRNETVKEYFDAKMTFLRRSTLTPHSQAAQLTEGMPYHFRPSLIAANPQDPISWLYVAQQLEESSKHFPKAKESRQNKQVNHFTNQNKNKFSDRKPPKPCRFCQGVGLTEWHWHSDCPRRSSQTRETEQNETNQISNYATPTPFNASMFNNNPHHFIHVAAKIRNSNVNALIDTASSIHLISKQLCNRINVKLQPQHTIELQMANGITKTLGQVNIQLTINNKTAIIQAQALPNPPFELLLGINIGDQFHIVCDLQQREAIVNCVNSISPSEIHDVPQQFKQLLTEFNGIFSNEKAFADAGRINIEHHRIKIKEHPPIQQRPYTQALADREETRQVN